MARAHRHRHENMLTVEEARERILAFFSPLDVEEQPLLDAQGQVLAEDVFSPFDIPPLDNSAMDGYAVQAESVRGASARSPALLRVTGSVAAGELPSNTVTPGTAVRIMTGAPIPEGADTVVPFEDTDEADRGGGAGSIAEIGVLVEPRTGADVRPAGQDVAAGDRVLESGDVLRPAEIGVLASLGRTAVRVIRRPVVAVLATGDELIAPGNPPQAGKIYDSNTFTTAASVSRYGGVARMLGIASDDLDDLSARLLQGLDADMLITSAGVSKGDYDVVKDVLARHGTMEFWSVRMRPAKPLAFGVLQGPDGRRVPLLGLPGNPVSALVAFEQFARPAILKMLGRAVLPKRTIRAVLEEPLHNTDGRRVFARAVVTRRDGQYYARLAGGQGSNILTSMARANGLAICPEDSGMKDVGEVVDVQMLDWPEEVI